MAGLVPAIHVFVHCLKFVDARHKAGHDESCEVNFIQSSLPGLRIPFGSKACLILRIISSSSGVFA